MKTLWIFGHQLSLDFEGFKLIDKNKDTILFIEAASRARWKNYHKKKLVLIFSAMRHFAEELKELGFKVDYIITDSFQKGWKEHLNNYSPKEVIFHNPTDYNMRVLLNKWKIEQLESGIKVHTLEENLFLVSEEEWENFLPDNKNWKLDGVYQKLRQKYNILIDKGKPVGNKWSFDSENRKPPKSGLTFNEPILFTPDKITNDVIEMVNQIFSENPGEIDGFTLPVNRKQSKELLTHFLNFRLPTFGDYQDAMLENNPYMSHSLISSSINIGLLNPLEVIIEAEECYKKDIAPLTAVEGFIRQILGWREYIRGVYLRKMPDYKNVNEFNHNRKLPSLYWNAKTNMNCLKNCVTEVLKYGYNHHIQRLMVLGNFGNLAGISPQEVAEWFNIMYTDAHDWVVLPNVLGMALYADGGTMSTKPYISSGQYINKMSNYCKNCKYKVSEKFGDDACPFNSLYWDFLMRNNDKLKNNPRMGMMYNIINKMDIYEKEKIISQSQNWINKLENGEL